MALGNLNVGQGKVITATGNVKSSQGALLGFFVSSSTSGTLTVYDDAATGTTVQIVSVASVAAATWYPMPIAVANGIYVVVGGTLSATCVFV